MCQDITQISKSNSKPKTISHIFKANFSIFIKASCRDMNAVSPWWRQASSGGTVSFNFLFFVLMRRTITQQEWQYQNQRRYQMFLKKISAFLSQAPWRHERRLTLMKAGVLWGQSSRSLWKTSPSSTARWSSLLFRLLLLGPASWKIGNRASHKIHLFVWYLFSFWTYRLPLKIGIFLFPSVTAKLIGDSLKIVNSVQTGSSFL